MALKVLITLLSLFVSGLLVGNELAVAVFIHPVLYSGFRRSARSGCQAASEAAWPLHAVFVRAQSGIRHPATADHATCARFDVALLCGRDALSSYYCSHDSLAGSN